MKSNVDQPGARAPSARLAAFTKLDRASGGTPSGAAMALVRRERPRCTGEKVKRFAELARRAT